MKLTDAFYTTEPVIDHYTFVFDKRDPWTGYYSMLATDHDGFSQWSSGFYEPGKASHHLGERPRVMSERLLDHLLARIADE
jgi:hypothetical protein